jgi:histidine kinase/DNA gyrase B/HSP90-like ATPase
MCSKPSPPVELYGAGLNVGLGLALTRRLVEAHGGELSFENSASGGTTFTFTLTTALVHHSNGTHGSETKKEDEGNGAVELVGEGPLDDPVPVPSLELSGLGI